MYQTTHNQANADNDEITNRIYSAVNDMLIEILAGVARRDYEQRRLRQNKGLSWRKPKASIKENNQIRNAILRF